MSGTSGSCGQTTSGSSSTAIDDPSALQRTLDDPMPALSRSMLTGSRSTTAGATTCTRGASSPVTPEPGARSLCEPAIDRSTGSEPDPVAGRGLS